MLSILTKIILFLQLAWAPGKGVKGKDLKDYWEGDLGVSYIPWSKLKPDIDLEMLEDGGMIDEDTMPAWMKAKVAEMSNKTTNDRLLNDDSKNALLATPSIDTTQPPPVPGAGLLQPPPLTLPLVNPFQLNNSILGAVGMNIPPGMMPNVPIGVPPPNMPPAATTMMNNTILGINSPFTQGPPPNLLQMQPMPDKTPEQKIQSLSDQLLSMSQAFAMPPQGDDNMDIEMEDANKSDSIVFSSDIHNIQPNFDDQRGRRDERDRDRGRRGSRSRDRGRDRDRNHRNSRDRGKDRKDDRRDRWSDRDRRERDERRERSEKSVNDRLWEMAEGYSSRDRPRDRNDISETTQPLLEKLDFEPPPLEDRMNYEDLEPEFDDGFRRRGPPGKLSFIKSITLIIATAIYR